jgi:hypothetical protein
MKRNLYISIEQYFEMHKNAVIYISEIYKYIGKQRTVLWRVAPEITSYVTEMVSQHNDKINKDL